MLNNPIILGTKLPTLANPGAAGDLLSGKQLIDQNGNVLTGTMSTKVQATPSISVNSGGLITASATQDAGYVQGGTKSATKQLTTQAAATITPGRSSKTAVAAGRYTTGAVTVAGDSNLIASNIKSGVSIFGVNGSYTGAGTPSTGYASKLVQVRPTSITSTEMRFTVSGLTSDSNLLGVGIVSGNALPDYSELELSRNIVALFMFKSSYGENTMGHYTFMSSMISKPVGTGNFSTNCTFGTYTNTNSTVQDFSISGNTFVITVLSTNRWINTDINDWCAQFYIE